ncbi:hypothetical protein [Streptomyces sp. NPDC005970]|uniref:hypothetical protein n=1 Tax=Streptomyces sp. NPDC005970 TaxID=3156723 RepID=UPI003400E5F9
MGVLLTPRTDGYRDWNTTVVAVSGDPALTDEELLTYQSLFNAPNGPSRRRSSRRVIRQKAVGAQSTLRSDGAAPAPLAVTYG